MSRDDQLTQRSRAQAIALEEMKSMRRIMGGAVTPEMIEDAAKSLENTGGRPDRFIFPASLLPDADPSPEVVMEDVKFTVEKPEDADLKIRVKKKLRDKYGESESEHHPADDAKIIDVKAAAPEDLPRGILKKVLREPRMSGDMQGWVMVLDINGCEIHVRFVISDMVLAASTSPKMMISQALLQRAVEAAVSMIKRGIVADMNQIISATEYANGKPMDGLYERIPK